MFKHILVPTDGSAAARKAAEMANRIARDGGAKVTLLAVAEYQHTISESFFFPFFSMPVMFPVHEESSRLEILEAYRKGLEQMREEIFAPSLDVQLKVLYGRPHEVIVDCALKIGADLIIVGACGLGAIEDALLGSVSDRVAHHAPCPVLISR